MVPNNVQLVQQTALVDANRGSDPQEIYEDLKLEISSQPCPKLREQIVKEFIHSNPNVHNMKYLRQTRQETNNRTYGTPKEPAIAERNGYRMQ